MRNELLSWFAREGLLLTSVTTSGYTDGEEDEMKVVVKAPLVALSRADCDFRECPDPIDYGYPPDCLDYMLLDDMHQFVLSWLEQAVQARMARCFVCNQVLDLGEERPWDAVFVSDPLYCWLLAHFDCKRYLNRDLRGRNPFEVGGSPPEYFAFHLGI